MSVSYFSSKCSQLFHAIAPAAVIQTAARCSSKSTSQLLREAAVPAEALRATAVRTVAVVTARPPLAEVHSLLGSQALTWADRPRVGKEDFPLTVHSAKWQEPSDPVCFSFSKGCGVPVLVCSTTFWSLFWSATRPSGGGG